MVIVLLISIVAESGVLLRLFVWVGFPIMRTIHDRSSAPRSGQASLLLSMSTCQALYK